MSPCTREQTEERSSPAGRLTSELCRDGAEQRQNTTAGLIPPRRAQRDDSSRSTDPPTPGVSPPSRAPIGSSPQSRRQPGARSPPALLPDAGEAGRQTRSHQASFIGYPWRHPSIMGVLTRESIPTAGTGTGDGDHLAPNPGVRAARVQKGRKHPALLPEPRQGKNLLVGSR